MTFAFYKILHVFGVVLLFMALGGAAMHGLQGGTRATNPKRGLVGATHGVALTILIVAGFGAAAKAGFMDGGFPGWMTAKLVVWLVFGAILTALSRKPETAKPLWYLLPILGGVAAWLAIAKPF